MERLKIIVDDKGAVRVWKNGFEYTAIKAVKFEGEVGTCPSITITQGVLGSHKIIKDEPKEQTINVQTVLDGKVISDSLVAGNVFRLEGDHMKGIGKFPTE